ncbi:MAG: YceI family protein [Bacteroides sp.]|jgi:polyisoprenoid-binding protein YceI|nr:YceI family protein [Bacteroides sp.]
MKRIIFSLMTLLIVFVALASSPSSFSAKTHDVTISGTSNLHDWTASVPSLNTSAELVVANGKLEAINRMVVEIDATTIKGSEGSVMDRKIAETLKADKNPRIVFRMTRVDDISHNGSDFTVRAAGTLSLGGTNRPLDVVVRGKVLPNGDVQFTGVKDMKMTTWQLEPPRAMLGALRTGDEVTVDFSVTLKN